MADGVAMGSPVSSVVANLFMENLETKAIDTAGQLQPRMWERYVDDVFSVVKRRNTQALLEHINGLDEQLCLHDGQRAGRVAAVFGRGRAAQ